MQPYNNKIIENYHQVKNDICAAAKLWHRDIPKLLVVSKYHDIDKITSLILAGQCDFAENIIQETQKKWPELRLKYPQIKLHLIGHLQSKKVKDALELFDVIETLDSEKLALTIKKHLNPAKQMEFYIQINIGEEPQKYGIMPNQATGFINYCHNDLELNISGLMAIPPQGENPAPYFAYLKKIAQENNINYLSQGMSSDFKEAIAVGTNEVRVGSAIFKE